ncbi:MAG: phosphatase PAP2 family protein [Pseudomonadota bacterium]
MTISQMLLVLWLLFVLLMKDQTSVQDVQNPMIALLTVLLAPALLVNGVLKSYWGRPRPYLTEEFGGEFPYVSPGTITDLCQKNCSFVSGETSAAFWLLALVVFLPKSRQTAATSAVVAFGVSVSLLRMGFGRHYFSDVVMSALFTVTILVAVRALLTSQNGERALVVIADGSNALTAFFQRTMGFTPSVEAKNRRLAEKEADNAV